MFVLGFSPFVSFNAKLDRAFKEDVLYQTQCRLLWCLPALLPVSNTYLSFHGLSFESIRVLFYHRKRMDR
jgi:hypothetical protein